MNTYQLQCFVTLARNLNYARTSEQMNTSQPAITRQIQSLEAELDTKLFRRSTRRVELTEDGKSFLADATSILEMTSRAKQKFEKTGADEIINFAIGCSGMAHMTMLVPVLRGLKQKYPNIHPTIVNLPLSQLLPKIDDGTVDVALGARLSHEQYRNCSYKEIQKTRLSCIFDSECELRGKEEITIADIRKFPSILYNPIDIPTSVMKQQNEIVGNRASSEVYFCDSAEAAIAMASAGIGIAYVPDILIPSDVSYAHLKEVPEISFGVYYKKGNLTDVSKEMIKLLKVSLKTS